MISHDIGVDQVVEVAHARRAERSRNSGACVCHLPMARLILEGALKDGDTVNVTFDGNDFLFNGKSDKKAA